MGIRAYVGLLAIGGAGAIWAMADWSPMVDGPHVPWWTLVAGFLIAERLVLHLRLRKDAHSFSMSEIPLIIALFLVTPFEAISAQLIANGLVLSLHRRQQPIKLLFNLAQFTIQTSVAFVVARSVFQMTTDSLGMVAWLAALAASLAALATADVLINIAILLSGGTLSRQEIVTVFALGSLGTAMNTSLALVAVTLLILRPEAALLGLAPPLVLFFAYRAYVREREEGTRLDSLYRATKALHASPQIETALSVTVTTARKMIEGEYAEVFLFPTDENSPAYRTSSGPGDRHRVMSPVGTATDNTIHRVVSSSRKGLLTEAVEYRLGRGETLLLNDAVVIPLIVATETVGILMVANRLGDVSSFDAEDVRLLETVAAQVSISLENGQLEDSLNELCILKDQLEELVRSKDELVASVSHELRTPLTAIVGVALELQAHREAFTPAETDELMGLLAEQSTELADIVDDLLIAARAESGTLELTIKELDITTELAALVKRFGTRTSVGRVTITGSDTTRTCMGDILRLRQIVRNLLSNADRYGGNRAWIEVSNAGRQVVIAVCDNGPGVGAASEQLIFEPYRRAEGEMHHPLSVGLGLAVSRNLARLMDGDLRYHRAGTVTRFEISLPSAEPPLPSHTDGIPVETGIEVTATG